MTNAPPLIFRSMDGAERRKCNRQTDHAFKAEETNTDTALLLTCKQAFMRAVNE